MKGRILGAIISVVALTACLEIGPAAQEQLPVQAPVTAAAEAVAYIIPAGAHYATQSTYRAVETERFRFLAKFDSSAIYTSLQPGNQADINKLYGLADCNAHHQTNSARFGWRWYEGELQVLAYCYINGERISELLGTVQPGNYHSYSIVMREESYLLTLDDKEVSMSRGCSGPAVGYVLYPYFGGDEVAPHTVSIWVQEQ